VKSVFSPSLGLSGLRASTHAWTLLQQPLISADHVLLLSRYLSAAPVTQDTEFLLKLLASDDTRRLLQVRACPTLGNAVYFALSEIFMLMERWHRCIRRRRRRV
jgi:hypothetical protein